jgi:DNA-binding transcriptional LysR family regulator
VVDLVDIETFLALAEELHFGHTADRLRVSGASVTKRIQTLERHVGAALFQRTSRRVELTPLGVRLEKQLRLAYDDVLAALADARAEARGLAGTLVVGVSTTIGGPELDRLIATFEQQHPNLRVELRETPFADPLSQLRAGTVDVAVNWLALDEPDLTNGPVVRYVPRVLAMSADHPLASQPEVSAEVLADYPVPNWKLSGVPEKMLRAVVPAVTPSGRAVRVHPTVVSALGEGLSITARGLTVHPTGATIVRQANRADLVYRPIVDLPPLPFGLIWCTAHENARIRAFAAAVGGSEHRSVGAYGLAGDPTGAVADQPADDRGDV